MAEAASQRSTAVRQSARDGGFLRLLHQVTAICFSRGVTNDELCLGRADIVSDRRKPLTPQLLAPLGVQRLYPDVSGWIWLDLQIDIWGNLDVQLVLPARRKWPEERSKWVCGFWCFAV